MSVSNLHMKCRKCNHEYDDSLEACPLCGEPKPDDNADTGQDQGRTTEDTTSSYGYQAGGPAQTTSYNSSSGSGAAPLVLGILSLLIPVVGIVLGIIAIVLGNSQRRAYRQGTTQYSFGQTGWILGIIGLACQAALVIFAIVIASSAMYFASDIVGAILGDHLYY